MRRVFISSKNCGLDWTLHEPVATDYPGPMVKSPFSGEWLTVVGGWTVDVQGGYHGRPMRCLRAAKGPDMGITGESELPVKMLNYNRQMQPLMKWGRWIVCGATGYCARGQQKAAVALSDDDGRTWRTVVLEENVTAAEKIGADRFLRWDDGACEPAVVELADGTLEMMVRTPRDHHYRYVSHDGGDTWEGPEKAEGFYSSNTMPTFLKLRDGRILFFWNNTQQLPLPDPAGYPEIGEAGRNGIGQFVFTNRDVLHCAVSEDNGRTWLGFREILLNDVRNCGDLRELGNSGIGDDNDKSVHQSQALELPDGKILVSAGQNPASRRLIVFDVRWLYETSRTCDFRHGYAGLSNFLYVKSLSCGMRGWAGHHAWNRVDGAAMVRDPDTDRTTTREVLQICRIRNPRLVSERQGAVWNFPAGRKGRVEIDCRIDGCGFRLSLCDHWMNPCDERMEELSPLSVPVEADLLGGTGRWTTVAVEWDMDSGLAVLSCGSTSKRFRLRLDGCSPYGLSYLHLQTLADGEDARGSYFREFRKKVFDTSRLTGSTAFLLEGRPAEPLPMDYDGDGKLDLVVTSPGEKGGTWFFRGNVEDDALKLQPGIWLCAGRNDAMVSAYAGKSVVLQPAKATWNFARDHFSSELDVWGTKKVFSQFHPDGVDGNRWCFVDYDGDGKEELVAGMGGRVYLMKRAKRGGVGPDAIYDPPVGLTAVDGGAVGTDSGPTPLLGDFSGSGGIDLVCVSRNGAFVYFANVGTRTEPRWAKGHILPDPAGKPLAVGAKEVAAAVVDWDSDGRLDVIAGAADGRVVLFRNIGVGATGLPLFASPMAFTVSRVHDM